MECVLSHLTELGKKYGKIQKKTREILEKKGVGNRKNGANRGKNTGKQNRKIQKKIQGKNEKYRKNTKKN